jgi:hypothetical protein
MSPLTMPLRMTLGAITDPSMQPAGEFDVAVDARFGADQGVDLRVLVLILIPFEHLRHPWPRDWG